MTENNLEGIMRNLTIKREPKVRIYDDWMLVHKLKEDVNSHIAIRRGKYIIEQDIIIKERGCLELRPGVELLFGPEAGIISYGTLLAFGTEREEIIFTSLNKNRWRNITLAGKSASNSFLKYCSFNWGGGRDISPLTEQFNKSKLFVDLDESLFFGGGLLAYESNPVIEYCTFNDNQADMGGAVYLKNSDAIIKNTNLSYNRAVNGGAIYMNQFTGDLAKNLIESNTAQIGAGVYMKDSESSLSKNIIQLNHAIECGGGIFTDNSIPSINYDKIMWNTPNYLTQQIIDSKDIPVIKDKEVKKTPQIEISDDVFFFT